MCSYYYFCLHAVSYIYNRCRPAESQRGPRGRPLSGPLHIPFPFPLPFPPLPFPSLPTLSPSPPPPPLPSFLFLPFFSFPPIPFPFPPHPRPLLFLLSSLPSEVGPLNPARGSRGRCKLPQRGLERSPSWNWIWCIYDFSENQLTKFRAV